MIKQEKVWRDFKADLASNIRSVADVLQDEGLIRDSSPLHSAAGSCEASDKEGSWEYDVSDLNLITNENHIRHYQNTKPSNIVDLSFTLNMSIGGVYVSDIGIEDPINHLNVECHVEAMSESVEICTSTWHLDRNVYSAVIESKYFVHPMYHFQYGGNKLPDNIGNFLFLEPPRLAHPPLDAVLAIDFMLSNYFPTTWQSVRENNERYKRAIQKAQNYFWKPYAIQIGGNWSPLSGKWDATELWPHLIKGSLYPSL